MVWGSFTGKEGFEVLRHSVLPVLPIVSTVVPLFG